MVEWPDLMRFSEPINMTQAFNNVNKKMNIDPVHWHLRPGFDSVQYLDKRYELKNNTNQQLNNLTTQPLHKV